MKDYHFVAKADQHSSMKGPQIIGWAKHGPINDGFHGNSEKMVSRCKDTKEMTHITKRISALIILTNCAKAFYVYYIPQPFPF